MESWFESLEGQLTWVFAEGPQAWFHGNGKTRIDHCGDTFLVSFRRRGQNGFYWEGTWTCETLEQAKELGESGFKIAA